MQVVDVQHELRRLDPKLTLGGERLPLCSPAVPASRHPSPLVCSSGPPFLCVPGINIDIENVGDCNRPLLLTYMREFFYAAGELGITVGDTVGFETGNYIPVGSFLLQYAPSALSCVFFRSWPCPAVFSKCL